MRAGALGRLYVKNEEQRSATVKFHAPEKWLKEVASEGNAIQKIEKISKQELLEELILTGLRLENGVSNELFLEHFNKNIVQIFDLGKLNKLQDQDLIEFNDDSIKISPDRKILANEIIFRVCEAIYSLRPNGRPAQHNVLDADKR